MKEEIYYQKKEKCSFHTYEHPQTYTVVLVQQDRCDSSLNLLLLNNSSICENEPNYRNQLGPLIIQHEQCLA